MGLAIINLHFGSRRVLSGEPSFSSAAWPATTPPNAIGATLECDTPPHSRHLLVAALGNLRRYTTILRYLRRYTTTFRYRRSYTTTFRYVRIYTTTTTCWGGLHTCRLHRGPALHNWRGPDSNKWRGREPIIFVPNRGCHTLADFIYRWTAEKRYFHKSPNHLKTIV